jgi:hypothetical protein
MNNLIEKATKPTAAYKSSMNHLIKAIITEIMFSVHKRQQEHNKLKLSMLLSSLR